MKRNEKSLISIYAILFLIILLPFQIFATSDIKLESHIINVSTHADQTDFPYILFCTANQTSQLIDKNITKCPFCEEDIQQQLSKLTQQSEVKEENQNSTKIKVVSTILKVFYAVVLIVAFVVTIRMII